MAEKKPRTFSTRKREVRSYVRCPECGSLLPMKRTQHECSASTWDADGWAELFPIFHD